MGQTTSSTGGVLPTLSSLPSELQRHTVTIRQLATLDYDQFLKDIEELNKMLGTRTFTDANGKRLVFAIKKGSDSSVLWKGTVRIGCVKVDSETGKIESYRLLNLRQFLQVQRTILYQASAGEGGSSSTPTATTATICSQQLEGDTCDTLTASLILNKVDDLQCQGGELDECCICLERKTDVILPCAHSYCLPCIEQWNVSNKTCPVCRETLDSTDDSWVISEKPDSAEMTAELQKCLIGLADERLPSPPP